MMRVNWVRRTLTMRRFEEERSWVAAGLNEVITDVRLRRISLPLRLWNGSADGSGSASGQRSFAGVVGLRDREQGKGAADEAFGDPGIAARNPLLGVASGYRAEILLLEKIGLHDDCHYRHDKHGIDRVPKHPQAQIPMASPLVAV